MKIEVNVTKKYLFGTFLALSIIIAGVFVFAYNSSPANPAVFGHSIGEIEGLDARITQIVNQQITNEGGIQCDSTPRASSKIGNGGSLEQKSIELPAECLSGTMYCTIKTEIYSSSGVIRIDYANFKQDSLSNVWWGSSSDFSELKGSQTYGKNGDSEETRIIPIYQTTSGNDVILLLDDSSLERSASNITLSDDSDTYGMKIYFCT